MNWKLYLGIGMIISTFIGVFMIGIIKTLYVIGVVSLLMAWFIVAGELIGRSE